MGVISMFPTGSKPKGTAKPEHVVVGQTFSSAEYKEASGSLYVVEGVKTKGALDFKDSKVRRSTWESIAYGNGRFVAVASASPNNICAADDLSGEWVGTTNASMSMLRSVAFGGGKFVAVGSFGTIRVSADGRNWAKPSLSITSTFSSVTYGKGIFVAVTNSTVITSDNGVTWSRWPIPSTQEWSSVCFGGGKFVAVSGGIVTSSQKVMVSSDGKSWTAHDTGNVGEWVSVCYGNGIFVAVAQDRTRDAVMTSFDGITWTRQKLPTTGEVKSVAYGNGRFVAVRSTNRENVLSSVDGVNWKIENVSDTTSWKHIAYGGGRFALIQSDNTLGQNKIAYLNLITEPVVTSNTIAKKKPAGIEWTVGSGPALAAGKNMVSYGGGMFAAATTNDTDGYVYTSIDGLEWTTIENSRVSFGWRDICYGDGKFVSISGEKVGIFTVAESKWEMHDVPTGFTRDWRAIAYGGGIFVAIPNISSTSAEVITSYDGRQWSLGGLPSGEHRWTDICYGQGRFVAVGNTQIMTSVNGVNWSRKSAAGVSGLSSVCYGGGIFVAVAPNAVLTSTDGETWTRRTIGPTSWVSVCHGDGLFIAVSAGVTSNDVAVSLDGILWTSKAVTSDRDARWDSVAYGNGAFVASGKTSGKRVMISRAVYELV